jgi:4-aminobutyrate aminotransferase-like enzyme/Ser/Thr protein kinase RdoA (MazF antagonist)/murein DD-endopeptidase MepM/ murein hydrolase activator NlpD
LLGTVFTTKLRLSRPMVDPNPTRPRFSSDSAIQIVQERFGLSAGTADSLPSDRDQNFLLTEKASGRSFVLKISHFGEDLAVLDLQHRMLEHLTRAGFPLSNVMRSADGQEVVELDHPEGKDETFFARLLTWIPGTLLSQVNPQTPGLLDSLGTFLGGMSRSLEDFSHPAQDRELKWDLQRAGAVIQDHLQFVEDPEKRTLLEKLSESFVGRLEELVPDLRTSVIHGDANDYNVLVSDLGPGLDPNDRRVIGVVDFGDCLRSYTAAEAAIAAAYAMLGKNDPFTVASNVIAGYNRAFPLNESEIAGLFPLMGLRLCTSVAIAAFQKWREPGNQYLTVSEAQAWDLLALLHGESPDLPHFLFRDACGLDPVPGSRAVVEWLGIHGRDAAPVVGRVARSPSPFEAEPTAASLHPHLHLGSDPIHVFDLSVDSLEFGFAPPPEDAAGWTELLFRKMHDVGAEVGVGRYDETRRWYTADAFRTPGDEAPEWRTVHLGIDLFLEEGSPVFAPFQGTVHSFMNNRTELDYGPTLVLEHTIQPRPRGAEPQPERTHEGEPEDERKDGSLRFWTLYGHLAEDVLARFSPGQEVAKGDLIAHIGGFPTNGNWPPHLHFQVITHLLGRSGEFPGVCRPSQRNLWKSLSPDPNLLLGIPVPAKKIGVAEEIGPAEETAPAEDFEPAKESFPPGPALPGKPSGAPLSPSTGRPASELLEARARHIGPNLSVAYARPIKVVRGEGQFLFDQEGQEYLDCVNNVPHVGHGHPRVVERGQKQMAVLNTNTRYLHDLLVDYAGRLVATLPAPLSVVYFVCTGSEANELALRLARTHTGRRDVLVVEGGYHGHTSALIDLSSYKFDGPGGEGAPPWVRTVPMPDPYRGIFRTSSEIGEERSSSRSPEPIYLPRNQVGPRYAQEVARVVSEMVDDGRAPAAFFCEPLLGCGGQIIPPPRYMEGAFQHVREAGGICVADEVQVGFGRVGTHFWAFQSQDVIPDIVTLGKPMANGHPMGAVVTTPEIAQSFQTGMEYFNTFGGNPVSCAIGMAVLDVIQEDGLQENARVVGERLLTKLRALKDKHPLVGDVRGLGLFLGIELVLDETTREPAVTEAARVKERLRDHRILVSTDGPDENVLKIKPPMVFTPDDADRLTSTLDRILAEDGLRRNP